MPPCLKLFGSDFELANAMDVGKPSNMERLLDIYPDIASLRQDAFALSISDKQIKQSIKDAQSNWQQTLCPHSACAAYLRQQEKS